MRSCKTCGRPLRSVVCSTGNRAKSIVYRGRINIGTVQESSIPQGVNWDLYVGPAPYRAFTLNRFHYGWHYFWDFSTTEVGNNGVHTLDVVRWGLAKQVHPVKIHCTGGQFVDKSDSEVPNVQVGTYEYEDGKPPWLESYLQDFFGTKTTPHAGRVPIVLHLLAPNRRAVQVTTDLPGFWARHYPGIRRELMRKYPRHPWPEDTSIAIPSRRR